MDDIEGCEAPANDVGMDEIEGCEAPADDVEGVHDIAKGSWVHKKLRAKRSMARYFSADVAGPLKIAG